MDLVYKASNLSLSNSSLPAQKSGLSRRTISLLLHNYAVHEVNALLWLLFILITAMLVKRVVQLVCLWLKGSRLPGPPSLASARHVAAIVKTGGPDGFNGYLNKLHKKYGSVVRLWFGPMQLLISVSDPDLIKQVLLHAKDRIPATGKALQLAFGRGSLFTASMDQAKGRRLHLCEEFNQQLVSRLHSTCLKVICQLDKGEKCIAGRWELDLRSSTQHIAFMVLGITLFGDCFLTWDAVDEFEKLLLLISKEACLWATYSVVPFWNKNFQGFRRNCIRLWSLTEEIIGRSRQQHEHLQAHEDGITTCPQSCLKTLNARTAAKFGVNCEDVIFGIITAQSCPELYGSNDKLCGSFIGMMFHGSLATAGIMCSALTHLAQHPDIQAKVHSEMDDISSQSSLLSANEIQKMHYLMAVLHESARLVPSIPLLQRSSLLQDLKLNSTFTVPAGSIIAIPVQLVQIDPWQWGKDAELFNPERFICKGVCGSQNNHVPVKHSSLLECRRHKMEDTLSDLNEKRGLNILEGGSGRAVFKDPTVLPNFLSFGAGSRSCVGRKFATFQIMILLAALLQRYKITLGPGNGKDLKPKIKNCVLQLSPSPRIILEPRHQL